MSDTGKHESNHSTVEESAATPSHSVESLPLSDWNTLDPRDQGIALLAMLVLEEKGYTMETFMAEHGEKR